MLAPANFSSFMLIASSILGATLASHMAECTGTTRFPPLSPSNGNLDAAQLVQYDYLANITKVVYGNTIITEDPDGSLQGPFNVLLYTPTIVQAWTNPQLSVAGLLTPIENEAAVLGVLSINKARYGIYAHTILAQKAGFTLAQVEDMLAGICPEGIPARQLAIYNLGVKLAQMRGPLDTASYNAAFAVLGREGVAATVPQAAAFMYSALMLNAGDVCLPEGVEGAS